MDRQSLGASAAGASEVIDVDARQPSGGGSKRTPRSGRTRSRKIVDDDDDDFEVPNAKTPTKRKTPPKRKTKAKKEENVAEDEPAAAPATKNGKRKAKAKKEEATVASASGGGGGALAFGGGDLPEDGVAPPPKKKWAGKPKDDPPNRGKKERPQGSSTCFAGMQFIITGILDSLLREECISMIKEHGGKFVTSPSKKVTHAVVGTEAGKSKISKIDSLGIKKIDEDGLFDIMRKSCPQQKAKVEEEEDDDNDEEDEVEEVVEVDPVDEVKGAASNAKNKGANQGKKKLQANAALWVDKYAPKELDHLVGNAKNFKDLGVWLRGWKAKFLHGNGHSAKLKDRGDSDYAAALLAGPPGIGKTSAAHIVCRAEGFEPHEFNASDVRNKGGVQALGDSVMVTSSMTKYMKSKKASQEDSPYPNGQVLVMDEVDGMSGGDRGGSVELIKLIKTSRIPIICICNDDSSPKMRTMANNCFKLKFRRPTAQQVSKRLTEIVRKEGFRKIEPNVLLQLAEGCHGDIRQMINLLQTWRTQSSGLKYGDVRDRLASEGKTSISRNIFELFMTFFKPGIDGAENNLYERTENYFADSDMIPLFVQENYITCPAAQNSIATLADAAESIAEGDICSNIIRGQQRWDLMPTCAVLSSIRPGSICAGGTSRPNFPSFFGNLSKGNKFKRIARELEMKVKAGGTSSGSMRSFRLDYIPALTTALATPLINGGAAGIDEVIERLDTYYLEKDPDWSDILESGVFPQGRGPLDCIAGTVKSALTRQYKKVEHSRSVVTGVKFGVANRRAAAGGDISKMAKKAGASNAVDVDPDSGDEEEAVVKDDGAAEFAVKPKGKKRAAAKSGAKAGPKKKKAKRS